MTTDRYTIEALFLCLAAGGILGLLFLALKLIRIVLGIKKIGEAVMDILFCAAAAIVTFTCTLAIDDGRVRFFEIAAVLIGLFAVIVTLEPFIGGLAKKVYIIIEKIKAFICKKSKAVFFKKKPKVKKSGKKPKKHKNKLKKNKKRLANFM